MARALVTGITGQDGSYLAEQLAAEGTEVHGMVHDADPAGAEFRVGHPGVHLHAGDLADQAGLAQLVRDVEPDELYNLAGISSVAYSWEQPVLTAELIPARLYSSSGSTSRTSWARPAWSARSPACRCTPGCPTRNSAPAGSASCTMPCTSVPSAASCSAR